MNVKEQISLTVLPPIPQKHLGRHRAAKGVYLIRNKEEVVYIGTSTDIYKTIMRLFQNQGALSDLDRNKLTFEVIYTTLRTPSVESVLKRYFMPNRNRKPKELTKPSAHEKKQEKRILEAYLEQTRFEAKGNHQTDPKNS